MYFIKITSVATETNKNFAGQIRTYLYGKQETLLETQGNKNLKIEFSSYLAKEYGYNRKCDAVRSMKRHQELNRWAEKEFPYWTSIVEIVEINV